VINQHDATPTLRGNGRAHHARSPRANYRNVKVLHRTSLLAKCCLELAAERRAVSNTPSG
jgi:hypothetical protein